MATEIKLPRLGQGMESGTIVKWLKSEGDSVEKGEPLYELDTDKVTQEVEADASGVLLRISIQEGEVEVGKTIAVIGEAGEEVAEPEEAKVAEDEQEEGSPGAAREDERERGREASDDQAVTEIKQPVTSAENGGGGRIKASPLARRIARERGIDLTAVTGTGPEGRVVAEDVERAAASPEPLAAPVAMATPAVAGDVEIEQLSSMRKTIARRLTEAWQAPVFQLGLTVDMERAQALRARLVALHAQEGVKPTVGDLLTKVCAAALMRHRDINALFRGDAIELHPSANVGIAVAIPKGLVVPVIRSCERLSIAEIAAARTELVGRAREGRLTQEDLADGTFTISNLGMYGIERFIAVLNPPQAAILAVGSIEDKVVAVGGQPVVRPRMEITLTADHRAVDGATGAQFLATVKEYLEEPGLAL
jgi:pyruvate dehydrogenase E2 component (dihydrolipoamide acetyltransferase)